MELVQEGVDEGKKILLFSQFTSVLKKYFKAIRKRRYRILLFRWVN